MTDDQWSSDARLGQLNDILATTLAKAGPELRLTFNEAMAVLCNIAGSLAAASELADCAGENLERRAHLEENALRNFRHGLALGLQQAREEPNGPVKH